MVTCRKIYKVLVCCEIMRNELYELVAERYSQMYDALKVDAVDGSVFSDVGSNLVAALEACAAFIKKGKEPSKWKKSFGVSLRSARDYFRLLKSSKDFRQAEFNNAGGLFPDLHERASSLNSADEQTNLFGKSPAFYDHYVYLVKQRLTSNP